MKLRPPAEPKYGTLIFDIETDGLLPTMTRIHVLCIREYETGQVWTFRRNKREDTIAKGVAMLQNARCVVGHNIAGFDLQAIELIFPDFMLHPDCIVQDTLVIVRVIFADQRDKDYRLWERGKLPGNLIGSMQLEAWGHRLRLQKGDYKKEMEAKAKELGITLEEDITRFVWGTWNQPMEDYCVLDVDVTTALWRKIEEEDYPAGPLDFEHDAHQMAIMIEENGWPFDIRRAEKLADDIEDEMEELAKKAEDHYGFWFSPDKKKIVKPQWEDPDGKNAKKKYEEPVAEYGEDYSRAVWGRVVEAKTTRKFKSIWRINPKTGERSINNNVDEGALYCPVKIKDFKPTSRHHIIDRFTTVHDWAPNDFTDTGQPSVNDDVLRGLIGKVPMAEELAEIFYLAKRLGQIATGKESWLNHVAEDGAIHHRLNVGGTISGRCAHSNPNIAQVPKVVAVPAFNKDGTFNSKAFDENGVAMPWAIPSYKDGKPKGAILTGREGKHGYDCRRLFYVPKGWRLVGCDLSGIELRCLANLTAPHDGGFLINQILEGDIHEVNRQAAGLDTRDKAKTFIYALVYGAGFAKIGSIVDPLAGYEEQVLIGKRLVEQFYTKLPGLGTVVKMIKKQAKRGWVEGIDGRRLLVRAMHAALNLRLQSDGAMIAKKWMLTSDDYFHEQGWKHGWDGDYAFLAFVHDELQVAVREEHTELAKSLLIEAAAAAGEYFNFAMKVDAEAKDGINWAQTH